MAAGLAALSPPLAILPFIDVGGTPDIACRRVLDAPDNASVPAKEEARDNDVRVNPSKARNGDSRSPARVAIGH